MLPPDIR